MRILFVLENYLPHIGGVEVVFKNLTERLVKQGIRVDVVTHRMKKTKKFEIVNGVRIHRVNCLRSRYIFTFTSIPKVLKLANKTDLIHTTTFNGAFPAWLTKKIKKKPAIITIHEVWIKKWRKLTEMGALNAFAHDILERMIYFLKFDKYVSVSNSTKRQLINIGIKKDNIVAIHNGVDYDRWNPKKYDGTKIRKKLGIDNNFVYLFYGRPGFSKGLEYLIKAVPQISKAAPNSKLLAIVSKDKQYKKRYRLMLNIIDKLAISDSIIINEPVKYSELPNYIDAADCVVVPSLAEGFGFAVAESCAMDKPVIASNTTSIPEVISGKHVLVKPKSPKEIAEGVISIAKGKKIKTTQLKKFLWKDNVKKYLDIYKELMQK